MKITSPKGSPQLFPRGEGMSGRCNMVIHFFRTFVDIDIFSGSDIFK
jgi:hypothetical protein